MPDRMHGFYDCIKIFTAYHFHYVSHTPTVTTRRDIIFFGSPYFCLPLPLCVFMLKPLSGGGWTIVDEVCTLLPYVCKRCTNQRKTWSRATFGSWWNYNKTETTRYVGFVAFDILIEWLMQLYIKPWLSTFRENWSTTLDPKSKWEGKKVDFLCKSEKKTKNFCLWLEFMMGRNNRIRILYTRKIPNINDDDNRNELSIGNSV